MRIAKTKLIDELSAVTEESLKTVTELKKLSLNELNFKKSSQDWSILECIQHLNLYGKYYLPEIERAMLNSSAVQTQEMYKSSFLGDYFVKSIIATNSKKMKAPDNMTPDKSNLSITTIEIFLKQLTKLKELLDQAKKVDLIKIKTSISLTKLVKLRLGDTLRFLVYHNERHVLQAERVHQKTVSYSE